METVTKSRTPTGTLFTQIVLMVVAALGAGGLGYLVATNLNSADRKEQKNANSTLVQPNHQHTSKTTEPCVDCDKLKLPLP